MKQQLLIVSVMVATLLLPQPTKANETLHATAETLQPVSAFVESKPTPVVISTVRQSRQPNLASVPSQSNNVQPGLTGSLGRAKAGGNCVLEIPAGIRPNGNPSTWTATTQTPYLGAVALFSYNHTGVVVGIWSNGDIEIRHQNYSGGQHRFPRSAFRGFR